MFKKVYQKKYFKILLAFIYSYLFYYGYQEFLYQVFEYMGFTIVPHRIDNFLLVAYTYLLAIIPVFLHKGILKISSFLCIFIYLILYVPIIFTFFFQRESNVLYIMYIQLLFFIGMVMLFLVDRIPVSRKFYLPSSFDLFKIILVLTWIGTLYIAYVYRGSLKFASYEDVYIQRSANADLGADIFTAYFGAWLANVFIPISSTYGLFAKKKLYFISGAVASLIFYMATADKVILLFPFIILCLYYLLRNKNLNNTFVAISAGLSLIMLGTLLTGLTVFASLFWMRTIGNGGLLTALYHEYFEHHPITVFTHINFINAITQSYPYGAKSLGQVVGAEYFSNDTNANANFWSTDGIASLGNLGIIFASLLLSIVFYFLNKSTAGYNKLFVICILIPYVSSLLNQSLFSSLLTGGALLIMFILSFKSLVKNPPY